MAGPITFDELAAMAVSSLHGVGPKRLAALSAMGLDTVLDLLMHYPRRFLDRTRQAPIAQLQPGESVMVLATVRSIASWRVRGNRSMVTADVTDGSGSMRVTFFNQPWRERQLPAGTEAVWFGPIESFRGAAQMTNPVVDLIGTRTGRIIAVYPQSEKAGLSTWEIGELVSQVLRRCRTRRIADPVPEPLLRRHGLVSRDDAVRMIHEPASMAETVVARDRLVYDELLRMQLALVQRKVDLEHSAVGISQAVADADAVAPGLVRRLVDSLNFELTAAQRRVISEIEADLVSPVPMHRLLQGDVGSGKTLVAVSALLVAVQGGHQGALMAPTEVLADQHLRSIEAMIGGLRTGDESSLFGDRPVTTALLSNRVSAAERRRVLGELAAGRLDILVGTHALIQQGVEFSSLGVVVIDEQHRFGVEQRAALRTANTDGTVPDVLVMTATPIPRTGAMTVYGDLDVSVLDEMPPGRHPVLTRIAGEPAAVDSMWDAVRAELAEGRQAYVVCPLVEESAKLEVASATETLERLASTELSTNRLALLHGRMRGSEKDEVMAAFRSGEVDALVATTVIEVGVDVPNATVMVVLDADRFGLAQLHQLRGRVGRGAAASYCWLVPGASRPDGTARLDAMVATDDGFELAEIDLALRGEGTILGERQKGRSDLRLASLRRDGEWIKRARDDAFGLVGDGTELARHAGLVDDVRLFLGEDDTEFLMKS